MKRLSLIIFVLLIFVNLLLAGELEDVEKTFPEKVFLLGQVKKEVLFKDYILGVMEGETRAAAFSKITLETQRKEYFKAHALIAQTYYYRAIVNSVKNGIKILKWGYKDEQKTIPNVQIDDSFQVYREFEDIPNNEVVKVAVNEVFGKAIVSTLDQPNLPIYAEYSDGSNNGFTINSEESKHADYDYHSYSRKQRTFETSGLENSHLVGFTQEGGIYLALKNRKYDEIIEHFYRTLPPYIRSVKIFQNNDDNKNRYLNSKFPTHENF